MTAQREAGAATPDPAFWAALRYTTENLGDDIQTLAALQYLPKVDTMIDRDRLSRFRRHVPHKIILNGWFMHTPRHWPPSDSVDPLLISMHLARDRLFEPKGIDYLKHHATRRPIGARDVGTLRRLHDSGVDAYFSGCLTLTLAIDRRPEPTGIVLAVDVPKQVRFFLDTAFAFRPEHASHHFSLFRRRLTVRRRRPFAAASLLQRYAASRCVVTGRLHVALPALALGTPVLFVTDNPADLRFGGLLEHLHTVSSVDFVAGRFDFDFSDPPPNPESWKPLADTLSASVSEFTSRAPRPFDTAIEELGALSDTWHAS